MIFMIFMLFVIFRKEAEQFSSEKCSVARQELIRPVHALRPLFTSA
jgi:hypothetical protein